MSDDAAQDWVDLERRLATEANRRGKSDLLSGAEAQALAEAAGRARRADAEAKRPPSPGAGADRTRRGHRGRASKGPLGRLFMVLALVLTAFVLGFAVSRVSTRPEARPGDRAAPAPVLRLDRDASAFASRIEAPAREPAPVAGKR